MIFDLLDYAFGELKMIVYKLLYFGKLKYHIYGKYSRQLQIRIFNKGRLHIGKNTVFRAGTKIRIQKTGKVTIGSDTGLNYYCVINAHDSISIGKNTIIGQNVKFYDHDHNYSTYGNRHSTGFTTEPIVVGDNVWIGSDCLILKGSIIGSNSVIAAGTVVKGEIPDNSLVYNKKEIVVKKIAYQEN